MVEQPIAGTPVYRVQPVTGGNIRTLHRNLLLPLGVKLEPDYNSDDSILEEDDSSSDESTIPVDTKAKVYDRKRLVKKLNLNLRKTSMWSLTLMWIFSLIQI